MAAENDHTVVIADGDAAWERLGVAGLRVVRVHPKDLHRLDVEEPAITIVNLAMPGVVELLSAWPRGTGRQPWACVTTPGSEHVVMLRGVAVMHALRPADPIAVHVRRRRRTARVVAAGDNAGALLQLRRVLGADGMGVSLAWDALQARDLCDLVHPHVVVLDLGLPRGGHDLVVHVGLRRNVPDLVLLPAGDDARAFADAFERARRRERVVLRREALAALAEPRTPGTRMSLARASPT
jgi:hypothetical protein